ncbi:MAG: glycerol-3-phosphate 1-O-acyltransferase PlsY [Spirochaetes bacterium]|nr:glycerol-3-phosphate 1-O-acyltransferase PlsY [Spirochaetota bacterium]
MRIANGETIRIIFPINRKRQFSCPFRLKRVNILKIFLIISAAWLLGSIPSAFIMTKIMTGKDIRTAGSGNSGATNVYRITGLKGAIPVFLFDFLKGFIPVWMILHSETEFGISTNLLAVLSGTAAFTGHLFPVFTGFRGGKGAATGAGIFTAIFPPLFPACAVVFITVLSISRKVSAATISAAVSLPVWYIVISKISGNRIETVFFAFMLLIPAAVLIKHHKNIRNLINRTEKKIF